ncbi:MAG: IS4/IS5 family transposase, partial [Deltaproteobacteria bacterium]|nr:IS4/IS5 family transposase [Deltaproteobacteria bacterium]
MSLENITNSYHGGKKWIQILKIKLMLAWGMLCDLCANLIEFIKNIITSEEFIARHRKSEKNITRNRCLPFASMIIFMMNLIKCALQVELDHFFKLINGSDLPERLASKAAFSMARKKIKYEAFVELCRKVASFFYDHFPHKRWHGFRLMATDGSTIKVPKVDEISDHFGVLNSPKGDPCPLARISHLFDVINKITIDAVISPFKQGERTLAASH